MNQKENNRLHTVVMGYRDNDKAPVCKHYYGDDQPDDWPMKMHDGIRMTKSRGEPIPISFTQKLLKLPRLTP